MKPTVVDDGWGIQVNSGKDNSSIELDSIEELEALYKAIGKFLKAKKPKKEKKTFVEYIPIASYLAEKIKAAGTDMLIKDTTILSWANDCRLMIARDGRTEEQIKAKIDAVFLDPFWSKQIRSAGTLREKWSAGRLDRLTPATTTPIENQEGVEEAPQPPQFTEPTIDRASWQERVKVAAQRRSNLKQ